MAGVPNGCVLGLQLWNIMYDSVFGLREPKFVHFADNLVVIVIAKNPEDMNSMQMKSFNPSKHGYERYLVDEKKEGFLIKSRRESNTVESRGSNP